MANYRTLDMLEVKFGRGTIAVVWFLLVFFSVTKAIAATPSTYYVRTDGGTATQCSGLVNAPYSGNVFNRGCAVSHPFYLFPPNIDGGDTKNKPLIQGGDIVMIAAGQYQMGEPFGTGIWDSCKSSNQWDCMMQPVPSGTAAAPTKIIGAGSTLTQLFGAGGASAVVNLIGSSYVVVQGIEITDHSSCIKNHPDPAVQCKSGDWASTGITNTDGKDSDIPSSNVTLIDVYVHGMAKYGALIGNVSNLTVDSSKFIANGLGGWSTDLAPAKSESNGVNTFTNVEFAWNGCTEKYPATTIWGCWGQSNGGYGDGFGSASSSQPGSAWLTATNLATDGDKGTWTFQNVSVHDNMQDGIDFLHADQAATINFDHVNAYRNVGNQLKGSGTVTITNSTVNSWCSADKGMGSLLGNNSRGGATSADVCRAGGDAIALYLNPGRTMTLRHNTVLSEGSCIITVADISGTDKSTGDATSRIVVNDNVLVGLPGWNFNPDVKQSCLIYWHARDTGQYQTNLAMSSNVTWHTNGSPPAGNTVADPKLANETLAGFDATLLAGSPAIGKASDGTNIGAYQSSVIVTPLPNITCNNGVVVAGACYCGAGTTLNAGTCGAVAPVCKPFVTCSATPAAAATCTAGCP